MTPPLPLPELHRPNALIGMNAYEALGGPLDGTEIRAMVTQVVLAVYISAINACWIAPHVGTFPPPQDRMSSLSGPVRLACYYALVQNSQTGLTWRDLDNWAEACSAAVRTNMEVIAPHLVPQQPVRSASIYAQHPGLAVGVQPKIRLVPDAVRLCASATGEMLRVLCEGFLMRRPEFFCDADHEHILLAFRRWAEERGWAGIPQRPRDAMIRFVEALRESPYVAAESWEFLGKFDVWESIHGDHDDGDKEPWQNED